MRYRSTTPIDVALKHVAHSVNVEQFIREIGAGERALNLASPQRVPQGTILTVVEDALQSTQEPQLGTADLIEGARRLHIERVAN